jgi:hypothetical protein
MRPELLYEARVRLLNVKNEIVWHRLAPTRSNDRRDSQDFVHRGQPLTDFDQTVGR